MEIDLICYNISMRSVVIKVEEICHKIWSGLILPPCHHHSSHMRDQSYSENGQVQDPALKIGRLVQHRWDIDLKKSPISILHNRLLAYFGFAAQDHRQYLHERPDYLLRRVLFQSSRQLRSILCRSPAHCFQIMDPSLGCLGVMVLLWFAEQLNERSGSAIARLWQ
jgi:hypothetical protein